jgi:hypothetical protein
LRKKNPTNSFPPASSRSLPQPIPSRSNSSGSDVWLKAEGPIWIPNWRWLQSTHTPFLEFWIRSLHSFDRNSRVPSGDEAEAQFQRIAHGFYYVCNCSKTFFASDPNDSMRAWCFSRRCTSRTMSAFFKRRRIGSDWLKQK